MFKPIVKSEQLVLGNSISPIAICSLWTPAKKAAEAIDNPNYYAVIGNLYSAARGITPLLQNLLANPHITVLIITGDDRSNSAEVLIDAIAGDDIRFVHEDLVPHLTSLRQRLTVLETPFRGLSNTMGRIVDSLPPVFTTDYEPIIVTIPDPEPEERLPAQDSGFLIRGQTVADCWVKILHEILPFAKELESGYDSQHIELLNLVTVVEDEVVWPRFEDFPDFVHMSSSDTASDEAFENYWDYVESTDKRIGETYTINLNEKGQEMPLTYTYGDRLRYFFGVDQVQDVISKLNKEPISKSAVICLWSPSWDNNHSGSPCLNTLWFRIREGKLYLTVTIRSNDMFAAWPANAYTMRRLQAYVRSELEEWNFGDKYKRELDPNGDGRLAMGSLTIVSESAHLYAHSYEDAQAIVDQQYHKVFMHDLRRYDDPKGSFVISIEQEDQPYFDAPEEHAFYLKEPEYFISVRHIAPGNDGTEVGFYAGRTAEEVYRQLAEANVVTQLVHAFYLGTELQKAEWCLKHEIPYHASVSYQQDQPLDINCCATEDVSDWQSP